MKTIKDSYGENPAEWVFCGKFPLKEIADGEEACREDWRNRFEGVREPEDWDMLSVVACDWDGERSLLLCRESNSGFAPETEWFSDIDDMLAEDWYLKKRVEDGGG